MWETRIEVAPPYHFDQVLDRLSMDPLVVLNKEERWVKVPMYINKQPSVIMVNAIGTKDKPAFLVSGTEVESKDEAIKRITHIFQWDVPLDKVTSYFKKTDLHPIFNQHEGTPLVLDFSPYFSLMKCIIHQQLNLSFAFKLTERFVKTFGLEKDGVWFCPLPEIVAELTVEDLRALQFSGRKAEYAIGTSKLIAEGKLDLDELEELSDEEVVQKLVSIRGIGPWTAQNYLMFALGRQNLFPMADIGIQNALKKLYSLEQKPSYEQMEEYSERWKPYLSYASLYLWRSIE